MRSSRVPTAAFVCSLVAGSLVLSAGRALPAGRDLCALLPTGRQGSVKVEDGRGYERCTARRTAKNPYEIMVSRAIGGTFFRSGPNGKRSPIDVGEEGWTSEFDYGRYHTREVVFWRGSFEVDMSTDGRKGTSVPVAVKDAMLRDAAAVDEAIVNIQAPPATIATPATIAPPSAPTGGLLVPAAWAKSRDGLSAAEDPADLNGIVPKGPRVRGARGGAADLSPRPDAQVVDGPRHYQLFGKAAVVTEVVEVEASVQMHRLYVTVREADQTTTGYVVETTDQGWRSGDAGLLRAVAGLPPA